MSLYLARVATQIHKRSGPHHAAGRRSVWLLSLAIKLVVAAPILLRHNSASRRCGASRPPSTTASHCSIYPRCAVQASPVDIDCPSARPPRREEDHEATMLKVDAQTRARPLGPSKVATSGAETSSHMDRRG